MTSLSAALEARDKATPKPWSADHSTVCAGDEELADFWHNALGIKQTRANATIAASAPDALDWIAKALPWVREMRLHVSLDPQHAEIEIAELDALIAQAEGKEAGG